MSTATSELEQFRAEISRILVSPEFASSRQLQDFLRYTSEKAVQGVTHIDQAEIALAVLGRGSDFNPVEDASVRKMASQLRQRLDQYYARRESAGDVMVILPVRSYVPRLERRAEEEASPLPEEPLAVPVEPPIKPRTGSSLRFAIAFAALFLVLAYLVFRFLPRVETGARFSPQPIILSTVKGDITPSGNLAPGSGVQLGPELREVDEFTARLDFTPRMEAQQAGLVIWQDPHHFIRLGRKFFGRNQIEFLLGEGNSTITNPRNTVYDADGQSGQPLWLSIHRDRNEYRAFLSRDGTRWEPHGEPIVPATSLKTARAGIFALNGRRDAPSIPASFTHLSTGVTFATVADASLEPFARSGWTTTRSCPDSLTAGIQGLTLRIGFLPNAGDCSFEIFRPVVGRDWDVTTRVDFFPVPGRSAGLRVAGSKSSIRLVRYFLNGPAIAFIHDGRTLLGKPDLNGSPAIFLRLQAARGTLRASFSADGEKYEELPVSASLDDLGGNIRGGLRFSTITTDKDEPSSIVRFFWYRENIQSLSPYR